jgi:hypothetical protein
MKGRAMMIPQGYKNGGKVKPFSGKDTKSEEMAEAKAVRSGKVSPAQYKAKEMAEEKRKGEKSSPKKLLETGKRLASGKMSASQYGNAAKMADGGYVCGIRSKQDYGK